MQQLRNALDITETRLAQDDLHVRMALENPREHHAHEDLVELHGDDGDHRRVPPAVRTGAEAVQATTEVDVDRDPDLVGGVPERLPRLLEHRGVAFEVTQQHALVTERGRAA